MLRKYSALSSALIIGVLWAVWHLPVVNFLGAAGPHGPYWAAFFLAFGVALIAVRVLIVWVYRNTRSLFLCQLMHVIFTGSLIAFGAPKVSSGQEALWYAIYGLALWFVVATIAWRNGKRLLTRGTAKATYPEE